MAGTFVDTVVDMVNSRLISRRLQASTNDRKVRVEIRFDGELLPRDVLLQRRAADRFRVTYSRYTNRGLQFNDVTFLKAYLHWLRRCPDDVEQMHINIGDGDEASDALFAGSADPARHIPIPDAHFYAHRGFEAQRALAGSALEWAKRSDKVVWRGGVNGFGRVRLRDDLLTDLTALPRLRLVYLLAKRPDCDVKIVELHAGRGIWWKPAERAGFMAAKLPETTWLGLKYAIDIDGHTNTWSNLLVRMLFGCCVLKVESPFGYRQWYYDRIRPFEHYVPVRSDLSDLHEKIDWVRAHDAEARAIAEAGQRVAMSLDFEAGTRDAVAIISANWTKSKP